MLIEKELQGHEQQSKNKVSTTYTPRSAPSSGLTKPTTFRAPPPASKRPTASGVSTTPKTPPTRPSDLGNNSLQVPTKSSSSVALNDVESENQQIANSIFPPKKDKSTSISKAEGIKLKGGVMLATKCDC